MTNPPETMRLCETNCRSNSAIAGADQEAIRWLGEQGWPTERIASAKGFRVMEVRRG